MLVSKGRYDDMRERAEKAEALLEQLLERIKIVDRSNNSAPQPRNVASERDDDEDETPPLPPPVEEAIARRARPGSQLATSLRQAAGQAMTRAGRDFDAELYARHIERGTRIDGWPL